MLASILTSAPKGTKRLLHSSSLQRTIAAAASSALHNSSINNILDTSKQVVAIDRNESILELAKLMSSQNASALFVEEAGHVIGMVKEADIIKHIGVNNGSMSTPVKEIMEKHVAYAVPSLSIKESLEVLRSHEQDHLPILRDNIDVNPESATNVALADITHMISAKHIIGQFYFDVVGAENAYTTDERIQRELEVQEQLKLPTVKTIMQTRKEIAESKGENGTMVLNTLVNDNISVSETIAQMTKFQKGSVAILDIVQDIPILVGIVTEQDVIRRAIATEKDLDATSIVEIMSKKSKNGKLVTVNTKDTLLSCAYKIMQSNVRHLPIVSPKGERIYGMISATDVVHFLC